MQITESQKQTINNLNPWYDNKEFDLGIQRTEYLEQIEKIISSRKQILFLLGSRRVGKTMIILQYIYKLIQSDNVNPSKILFLSLDNSNLDKFDLYNYLVANSFEYIFLDEVHYQSNWAQILKSLYDLPTFKAKIICSGSSSSLIEDNKAFLVGRATSLNIFPLSYTEFLKFNPNSRNLLQDYLNYGGYPEFVLEKQPNYLNELVRDIIEKDIVKIHKVKNPSNLFDIASIIAKQIGYKNSPNKISNVLGLDQKTINNYLDYLKEVRLISVIYKFSKSINERLYSQKKYYFQDLGMRNSFTGFVDIGALVENAVFIKLSQVFSFENIFYFSNDKKEEIDFVVKVAPNEAIFIESKYKNIEESILNSISKIFWSDLEDMKVTRRIIVTNDFDKVSSHEGKKFEFMSLENFLRNF